MGFLKRIWPFLLLVLLSLFAIFPLFHPGFFPMHDDTQPARVFEMTKSLRAGMFPVRWVFDLGYGYGYPIFNFYAPLAYYIGAFFMLIGFDALIATKIMMVIGIVFSGFTMYLLAKEFWGKSGALVSALLYLYFPYHAVNIYVRGAVAEFWAYAFIPLVFWAFYKLFKENSFKYVIFSVISYAALILSHNLTAMMVTPFLIILLIFFIAQNFKRKNYKNTVQLLFATLLSFLISSFYWIPALLEMGNTNVMSTIGGGADFKDHFVCLSQLWFSPWGYGGSAPGCNDGLSFMLGKTNMFIVLLSIIFFVFILIYNKKFEKKIPVAFIFALLGLILSIFLLLSESKFIWELFSPMKYFQYPWRFLNLVGFFMAFLGGAILLLTTKVKNKYISLIITILFLVLIVLMNVKFFQPQKIVNKSVTDYTSDYALKWKISKISDEYLPKNIAKPKNAQEALTNKVLFSFSTTPIENTSNFISLAGIVALFIGIISTSKSKNE